MMPKRSASPSVARPRSNFSFFDDLAQLAEVLLVALGREAAEVRVAIVVDDLDLDAGLEQEVVEVVARGAVQRVDGDAQAALADRVDVDLLAQLVEVAVLRIDLLDQLGLLVDVEPLVLLLHRVDLVLDRLRDLGQRRRAVRRRELQPVVLGRVVRRGEVDRAHGLAADGLERDARRRHVARAEKRLNAVERQDLGRLGRELLREEARVVGDDDAASFLSALLEVVGDPLGGDADVLEGEVFSDDAAPARSSEFDHPHLPRDANVNTRPAARATAGKDSVSPKRSVSGLLRLPALDPMRGPKAWAFSWRVFSKTQQCPNGRSS